MQNLSSILFITILVLSCFIIYFYKKIIRLRSESKELTQLLNTRTVIIDLKQEQLEKINNKINDRNSKLQRLNDNKSEILGMIAHDLKNSLTTIFGYTELLMDDIKEPKIEVKSIQEDLAMIEIAAKSMHQTIHEILDAEMIEHGNIPFMKHIVSMEELLNAVLRTYSYKLEMKIIVIHTEFVGDCHMLADEERMREIFDNLINNAIKYSPSGSDVYIHLEKVLDEGKAYIFFTIIDEGPGFTSTDLEHVFERFVLLSAKPTGGEKSTGLGLSIVKKLVTMHGGTVTVINNEEKGAKFTVKLPIF